MKKIHSIDIGAFDKYYKNIQIRSFVMLDQQQLLSTRQAAQILGVSVRTIQLWVEQGLLQAWKTPGGHRRIDQQSLIKVLQRKQREVPLLKIIAMSEQAEFFSSLQHGLLQWQLPAEVSTTTNSIQALLQVGQYKADIVLMHQIPADLDINLLLKELARQNCQLVVCHHPEQVRVATLPYLSYPFDLLQLKALIEQSLLHRVRQQLAG